MDEKPQPPAQTPIDVEQVNIENVTVTNPGPTEKRSAFHNWVSLTPLLSVLITGAALASTSAIQLWQNHTASTQKVDSDWRTSLEKVSLDEKEAAIGAFEMQSFFGSDKYGAQARSIASALLPNIVDEREFDAAFFVMLPWTDNKNQNDLVNVARSITNNLADLQEASRHLDPAHPQPADASFENFIQNPDQFFDPATHSDFIKRAQTEAWKLESVSNGLSSLWTSSRLSSHIQPRGQDLSGIVFLGNNFKGVDFRAASLDHSEFVGSCTVDPSLVPRDVPVKCTSK